MHGCYSNNDVFGNSNNNCWNSFKIIRIMSDKQIPTPFEFSKNKGGFYDPNTERKVFFAYDVEKMLEDYGKLCLRTAIKYTLEQAAEKAKTEDIGASNNETGDWMACVIINKQSILSLEDEINKQLGL